MKWRLSVLAVAILMASPAFSQQTSLPLAEVFGGGSYYRVGISNGTNLWGWQGDIDYNVSRPVSVVLDFAGQYKKVPGLTTGNYQYLLGPRLKHRRGNWTGFVEGLFGGDAVHIPGSTRGGFALGFGGGMDVSVSRLASIRLFEVDSLHNHFGGNWNHDVRVSAGVVFKFYHSSHY